MIATYEITTMTGRIYRIADDPELGLLAQTPCRLGPAASVDFRIGEPGEIQWASGGGATVTDPVGRIVQRIGPRFAAVRDLDALALPAGQPARARRVGPAIRRPPRRARTATSPR